MLAQMPRCPKDPTHDEFITSATVVEDWVVDREGHWIETVDGEGETVRGPDPENIWTCRACGADVEWVDR